MTAIDEICRKVSEAAEEARRARAVLKANAGNPVMLAIIERNAPPVYGWGMHGASQLADSLNGAALQKRKAAEYLIEARRSRLAGNPAGAAQWADMAAGARAKAHRLTAAPAPIDTQITAPALLAAE